MELTIEIYSELGSICFPIANLQAQTDPALNFILEALKQFDSELQNAQKGYKLIVRSEFKSTIGLGSSAAVLAATLTGLNHIFAKQHSLPDLWMLGKKVIITIQGRG